MKIQLCILVLVSYGASAFLLPKTGLTKLSNLQDDEPEMHMSTVEMLEYFGYPAETHHYTTEDGYIIGLHRIPGGRNETEGPKTPVLLWHGLLCSSADWVVNFPNESLGFMLADAGYDVWLGNARGNTYSRNHTTLDPDLDEEAFFHFTWDQMGEFDVPGAIDYIIQTTGYEKIYYVGHSMGTTMAFAMLATRTEYNDKIETMIALGPVANMNHVESAIKYLAPFANQINEVLQFLGVGEFLPTDGITQFFAQDCDDTLESLCEDIIYLFCGYDPLELNGTRMDVYMSHTPAGTSTWTIVHYAQEIDAGRFRHCNWGAAENIIRYGHETPTDYDITLITAPVHLFWGANDLLADPEDVDVLAHTLPNLVESYQVGGPLWSHMDFLWGIYDGPIQNKEVISRLPRY